MQDAGEAAGDAAHRVVVAGVVRAELVEYVRNGTLSLYAALETRTGRVIGKTVARHTSEEFVAFLGALVAALPPGFQAQPGWRIGAGGSRLPVDLARLARLRLTPDVRVSYGATESAGAAHGFAAGLDFETRILVKRDAPELLRAALASRRWRPQPIMMSGVTDPYQPAERRLLNVVEEMAIASGIAVPQVFVMDDEPAINAFAAGYSPSQAAVVVTRGTDRMMTLKNGWGDWNLSFADYRKGSALH